MKWIRLIRFIRRHRLEHRAEFQILTNGTEVIISAVGVDWREKGNQLRITARN